MFKIIKESHSVKKQRAKKIISLLKNEYPQAHCSLDYKTPWQLLVATRLSAQCTDERVNQVTPELFRNYKTPQDFAGASQSELEKAIKPTGFFRGKAKSIRSAAKKIVEEFGGKLPKTMEGMLCLDGVGRKSANVVLGNAFGIPSGIAVDTHVFRLSKRLGFSYAKTPEKMEQNLMKLVPVGDWLLFPHLMIWHGRKVCQARKPRCSECSLSKSCPSSLV